MKHRSLALLPPLIAIAAALLLWEIAVRAMNVPAYLLPPPSRVAVALWDDRAALAMSTMRTASATLAGFLIAAVLGIVIGSLLSTSRRLERGLYPLTLLFQMVPLVAIAPLLVIWLGNGIRTVIASSAVVAIFPVIANTLSGLRSADPHLDELFTLHHATRWQRWFKLGLPSAVPSMLTGCRIAAGLATIGAVVGEFVAGFGGASAPLGIVIMTSLREFRTEKVFAAVALASLVGFALFGIVNGAAHVAARRYAA
ncbi:MAG: ABC transporter permease [Phycisphaerae bacterium]|nr:ABC transporter permease [Phycisphaerae bacterium]